MPSCYAIASYWLEHEDLFPENRCFWIGLGEPYCMACGQLSDVDDEQTTSDAWKTSGLERAHLIDRCSGGLDGAQNLVTLCRSCHRSMPSFVSGDEAKAMAWLRATEFHGKRKFAEMVLWAKAHDLCGERAA
jgi:5-methylcytosine-specific restriction endonuclease McrA